jgi:DNA-binding CsgD family transcriptional regulator
MIAEMSEREKSMWALLVEGESYETIGSQFGIQAKSVKEFKYRKVKGLRQLSEKISRNLETSS